MTALIDALKNLGFTEHESKLYLTLYQESPLSGYEAAKKARIPRANAYTSLTTLVEKGGAVKIEGDPLRYQAVPFDELADNIIRHTTLLTSSIQKLLPTHLPSSEPFATLEGDQNIRNKLITMLQKAVHTVYLDVWQEEIKDLKPYIYQVKQRGVKIVVISVGDSNLEGIWSYNHSRDETSENDSRPLRIIIDSNEIMIGEIGNSDVSKALHTKNNSIVNLVKENFIHDILLLEIMEEYGDVLSKAFGDNLSSLRSRISGDDPYKGR